MLSSKIKDLKIREKFSNSEKLKRVEKFVFVNALSKDTSNNDENVAALTFERINLNKNSKVRITRRCVVNNRNRSVIRPYGISRTYLRELLQFGLLPGYSKAVW